jgi:hypothetical protein
MVIDFSILILLYINTPTSSDSCIHMRNLKSHIYTNIYNTVITRTIQLIFDGYTGQINLALGE